MSKIIVLGATGSLGKHIVEQAVAGGHDVSVLVRTPSKLQSDLLKCVTVRQADITRLSTSQLADIVRHQDALINTAGRVSDGQSFVALVDHVISSIETLPEAQRPVCWFLAGAGMLEIGNAGHTGVDLPIIKKTYWPHLENFNRLRASSLDWRLLCPGPMVEGSPIGVSRLRISSDGLPVFTPAITKWLPNLLLVPFFAWRMPEMIVPYADAATLMLSNLQPANAMSRHRIGLALPLGMRGKKKQWVAQSST